jgi:hypothetical protein
MPSVEHVLRVRRTDNPSDHLLVNVARNGRNQFDVKLIATDKEALYATTIHASDLRAYQGPKFDGNLDEWTDVLAFALFHRSPHGAVPPLLDGVETVGSITDSTLTLTIRRNVGGIKQRLGSIQLPTTVDEEINALDWADVAAATSDNLRAQLETLQTSYDAQLDQIAKLNAELDMLIRAKKDHEHDLFTKFAAVLNAKKLRIRDQQRLLNSAKIDPSVAARVSDARSLDATGASGVSRRAKRKAPASPSGFAEAEDANLDYRERMDDEDSDAHESNSRPMTPEPEGAPAAADTESEDDDATMQTNRSVMSGRGARGKPRQTASQAMDVDVNEEEPPPAGKKMHDDKKTMENSSEEAASGPTPAARGDEDGDDDDDDDETEDDEL